MQEENRRTLVMLVDDDNDVREELAALLGEQGYEVVQARDGADALDRLRYCASKPHLILLDLFMPRMDGWGFRREQLTNPAFADIPVVLLSAAANLGALVTELRAAAAVSKPIALDVLFKAIQAYASVAPHSPAAAGPVGASASSAETRLSLNGLSPTRGSA